jgi:hypothetical protein
VLKQRLDDLGVAILRRHEERGESILVDRGAHGNEGAWLVKISKIKKWKVKEISAVVIRTLSIIPSRQHIWFKGGLGTYKM